MTNNISINQQQSHFNKNIENKWCIYRITNICQKSDHYGWTYIGQHKYYKDTNPMYKYKGSGVLLQKDYKFLDPKKDFIKEVIICNILSQQEIDELEKFYIKKEKENNLGQYNLHKGGIWKPREKGQHLSEKTKLKLSKYNLEHNAFKGTHYYNNGIIEIRAFECPDGFVPGGLPKSEEQKLKISQSTKGIKKSEQTKENMRKSIERRKKEGTYKNEFTSTLGKKIYNNGQKEIFSFECPPGFIKGRLQSSIDKVKEAKKSKLNNSYTL